MPGADLILTNARVLTMDPENPRAEAVALADRVLVMRCGQLAGELQQSATTPITQEDIMALATGTEHVHA